MFFVCLPTPNKRLIFQERLVGNARFTLVYIPLRRGRPRWRLLRKKIKETPFQALVAEGLTPPEFIRPYYTDGYYRRLLLNAFLYVTAGAEHLALVDPDGRMPEIAAALLERARQVTVFTFAEAAYAPYCSGWLATLGTQPVFTQRLSVLQGARGIFAPFACGALPGGPNTLLFGPGGYGIATADLPLPLPYLRALPAGISAFAFAAALYTQCGETALQDLLPPTLIWGNGRVNIHNLKSNNFCVDNAK